MMSNPEIPKSAEYKSERISIEAVEGFVNQYARGIDKALFSFEFKEGSPDAVMTALATFQNKDGGFGHGVEPDMRLPESTALSTWMAFQIIKDLPVDRNHPMVASALEYFVHTFDHERAGWPIVVPEVDDHPHAPWWTYETAMRNFGWGNPSAEILGLLMKYEVEGVDEIITAAKNRALNRLNEIDPSSFHEVLCFKALYEMADDAFKDEITERVTELVGYAIERDPNKWTEYVATPLKMISGPDDPFVELIDPALLEQNLDFVERSFTDGDHWEPNWDWSGNYPDEWEKARVEWSGHWSVMNLKKLKAFGR